MQDFAFITRHSPTQEQIELAAEEGINLIPIGDMDAFTCEPTHVAGHGDFIGVVVVHPAAAMRMCKVYDVAVFENGNRAPEGEKPEFFAKALHVYKRK